MRSSCKTVIFGAIAAVISTSCFGDARSSGSGFAIADGTFIITSNHVVDGCASINIPDVGPATVLRSDRRADLAILRPSRPLVAGLRFRSGHPVKLGEEIVVIGFPLRGLLSSPPTVTTGIVSSLAGIGDDRTELQISAPVQPGNSGGPVLDRAGNVVGVVGSKLDTIKAARLTGDIPQNVNFAVHAAIVTSLLDSYSISYDIGLLEKEKPISDIVSTALSTIVVIECLGSGVVENTPQLEARSRAVTPCAGNSDAQVILPVRNLYDAIRHKDIDRYADQWRADGVYVRADKGTVRNLEAKLEERRSAFRRWKSVYLNASEMSVDHKEILSATIRVRYLMVIENVNGSISNDAEILETYDVACSPPIDSGRWLITKNVDYVRKFDNGK
jgi:S1-C subfamily serine protease